VAVCDEVLTVVLLMTQLIWKVTLCQACSFWYFGWRHYHHL